MIANISDQGFKKSGAVFSEDRLYRYVLWRIWNLNVSPLCVVGLNPSTADEVKSDPTVTREIGFAKREGYGGLVKFNLCGYRATSPRDMLRVADPVGPGNDEAIKSYSLVWKDWLLAWGANAGKLPGRAETVLSILKGEGCRLFHLGLTSSLAPRHPLYIPSSYPFLSWEEAGMAREELH